ncbi:MAG: hypothetical protein M3Z09_10680 [Acidobacteriota bacterium]|nr:hypothetical protein [Acidobacteriota bacterium]
MKFVSIGTISILLCSCASAPSGPPDLPESASFGWQLKSMTQTKPEAAPETVRALGFMRSWRAEYGGPGVAHVDVYRLKSEAAGLEMTQRWRPSAQTVTIFNARYFVVVAWEGASRAAATALVGRIEKSLPGSD